MFRYDEKLNTVSGKRDYQYKKVIAFDAEKNRIYIELGKIDTILEGGNTIYKIARNINNDIKIHIENKINEDFPIAKAFSLIPTTKIQFDYFIIKNIRDENPECLSVHFDPNETEPIKYIGDSIYEENLLVEHSRMVKLAISKLEFEINNRICQSFQGIKTITGKNWTSVNVGTENSTRDILKYLGEIYNNGGKPDTLLMNQITRRYAEIPVYPGLNVVINRNMPNGEVYIYEKEKMPVVNDTFTFYIKENSSYFVKYFQPKFHQTILQKQAILLINVLG